MWTIAEIKESGKRAFKANYWPCVLVAFLMALFEGGGSVASSSSQTQQTELSEAMSGMQTNEQIAVVLAILGAVLLVVGISIVVRIFLANPIALGGCNFFKTNHTDTPASLDLLKTGFQNYGHTFVVLFVRDLYLVLWTLLLIVPGIIKAYSYCMVPYILAEHPELSANEVITRSREMMQGNKGRAFLLDLSFFGWILLSILTLGLLQLFWTGPYMESTHAALYLKLKEQG